MVAEETFTGEAALEEDLAIAARTRVPVLITASRSDPAGIEGVRVFASDFTRMTLLADSLDVVRQGLRVRRHRHL